MVARFKRNRKRGSRQNIFFSILLTVGLILVISFLVFTNWKISQRRAEFTARIDDLKKEIEILEQKNQELKEDISQAGSQEYLEKVAREKLGMKAPGEEVVVINREREEQERVRGEEKSFWNPAVWWEWFKSKF